MGDVANDARPLRYADLSNWAPAFAGVDGRTIAILPNQNAAVALAFPIIAFRTKGIGGPPKLKNSS